MTPTATPVRIVTPAPTLTAASNPSGAHGTFTLVPALEDPELWKATPVLLADGRVLLLGGGLDRDNWMPALSRTTHFFDPKTGILTPGPNMVLARATPDAVRLKDGRVLVEEGALEAAQSEIFDPVAGAFTETGSMLDTMDDRMSRTHGLLLQSGEVLVPGDDYQPSAQLFDQGTGQYSWGPKELDPQPNGTVTLLPDGRVLFAGGGTNSSMSGTFPEASAEIYDPRANQFKRTGTLLKARVDQTAVLLRDGRVLVMGGLNDSGAYSSAEIYDPRTEKFSSAGWQKQARSEATSTLLSDGRVLLVGGFGGARLDSWDADYQAEIYDPATGRFARTGRMKGIHSAFGDPPSAILLPDGRVLVFGAESWQDDLLAELYWP